MSHQGRPLISPSAAAAELGCETWMIRWLIRRRVLHPIRVNGGGLRIRSREVAAFASANRAKEAA